MKKISLYILAAITLVTSQAWAMEEEHKGEQDAPQSSLQIDQSFVDQCCTVITQDVHLVSNILPQVLLGRSTLSKSHHELVMATYFVSEQEYQTNKAHYNDRNLSVTVLSPAGSKQWGRMPADIYSLDPLSAYEQCLKKLVQ